MSPKVQKIENFAKIEKFGQKKFFFAPKSPILGVIFSDPPPRGGTREKSKIEKTAFSGPILGGFRGSKSNSRSSIAFSRAQSRKSFAGSTPRSWRNRPEIGRRKRQFSKISKNRTFENRKMTPKIGEKKFFWPKFFDFRKIFEKLRFW